MVLGSRESALNTSIYLKPCYMLRAGSRTACTVGSDGLDTIACAAVSWVPSRGASEALLEVELGA